MEPRIQYAQTKDGVSIAFSTLGKGMPLVHLPLGFSHVQLEWKQPEPRRWYERIAERRMLVRFDLRGFGLSQREVEASEFSLDSAVMDLEAVVDRLRLERFALLGGIHTGPPAVAYAARHPERVSHLVLWCTYTRGADWSSSVIQATRALIGMDWNTYTETMAHAVLGWSEGEPARRYAELTRESCTPEYLQAVFKATGQFDVASLLPQVTPPTLVLHRRAIVVGDSVARGLASRIPDARLLLLDGDALMPYLGDSEAAYHAIDEFLGEGEAEAKAELPEGMAVILFADIANSTALTEQLGDAAFRAKARELDRSLRAIIGESGGTPVEGKVLGDGVLAVFASARQAIECALRCNANSEPLELQLHLGIHAGDVIREGNNVYGGAVNIAARIAGASAPGEVLVSDTVRSLARTSAGVTFDDRGEHELKGVGEPQRLFAVKGGG